MSLMKQRRMTPRPDGLPYWLWKDYAHHIAPVLTKVLNLSSNEQEVLFIKNWIVKLPANWEQRAGVDKITT